MIDSKDKSFALYADPPYVAAGKSLYEKYFTQHDHNRLFSALEKSSGWVLSYDDHVSVRGCYDKMDNVSLHYLNVSAAKHSGGSKKQTEMLYIKP